MSRLSPEEQARGLAQLREWVVSGAAPEWVWPLAAHTETTEELARALGDTLEERRDRCLRLLHEDYLHQPLYLRRLWAHMARVLCARMASRAAKA